MEACAIHGVRDCQVALLAIQAEAEAGNVSRRGRVGAWRAQDADYAERENREADEKPAHHS